MKEISGHKIPNKNNIRINPHKNNSIKRKKRIYIDYIPRIIILSLFILAITSLLIYLIKNSFSITDEKRINITERSDIDYKVYLKKNNFYEEEYLNKGMSYVSSLIKKINIDFTYDFNTDKKMDCEFRYNIVAKLLITDTSSNKTFFKKEYILNEEEVTNLNNKNIKQISKNVEIDYGYYNDIANKFRSLYGVNADSKLIILLNVSKKTDINGANMSIINNPSITSITIPLTEKSININIDNQNINNYGDVIEKSNLIIDRISFILVSIFLFIIDIFLILKLTKLLSIYPIKKSNYDNYISKILREYDRLIAETKTMPKMDNLTIFKISNFQELLDVRDNIKSPIMYYNIAKHNKCCFYIKNNNDIYILKIKAIDLY